MLLVKLKGISKKGRERVKQHGEWWKVIDARGDALLLTNSLPLQAVKDGDWRWVKTVGDPHFEITERKDT
jgi:hypothetical protein